MPKVTNGYDWSAAKTHIVISMPGKVVKTTKGKIEGNKVVFDSLDFFNEGIMVTAEKEGASKASTSDGGPSRPSNEKTGAESSRGDSAGSFPVWGWGLAGGGILAVVAGAWLILGRKRGTVRPDHRARPEAWRPFNSVTTGAALRPQSAGHKPTPLSAQQRPGRAPVRLRLQRAPDPSSSAEPRPHTRRPRHKIPPAVRLGSTSHFK